MSTQRMSKSSKDLKLKRGSKMLKSNLSKTKTERVERVEKEGGGKEDNTDLEMFSS